jgi:hypothetical protein
MRKNAVIAAKARCSRWAPSGSLFQVLPAERPQRHRPGEGVPPDGEEEHPDQFGEDHSVGVLFSRE